MVPPVAGALVSVSPDRGRITVFELNSEIDRNRAARSVSAQAEAGVNPRAVWLAGLLVTGTARAEDDEGATAPVLDDRALLAALATVHAALPEADPSSPGLRAGSAPSPWPAEPGPTPVPPMVVRGPEFRVQVGGTAPAVRDVLLRVTPSLRACLRAHPSQAGGGGRRALAWSLVDGRVRDARLLEPSEDALGACLVGVVRRDRFPASLDEDVRACALSWEPAPPAPGYPAPEEGALPPPSSP